MQKQLIVTALIVALSSMLLLPFRSTLAYESIDVALDPISGSNCDPRSFEYSGHTITEGFAVSISAQLPFATNTQIKWGYAIAGLSESWEEEEWYFGQRVWWQKYNPYVKEMWVNVEGDSYYTAVDDAIFDNTGTGEHSWEFLAKILEALGIAFSAYDIYQWLSEVYAQPPVAEWVPGLHSSRSISRQGGWMNLPPTYVPWLGSDKPRLQTAGANTLSTFSQTGPHNLTVTAQAEIYVQRHNLLSGGVDQVYIGTYSVSFEVSVPVGVYTLNVRTYLTTGQEIFDVKVWVDNDPERYSWVSTEVGYGTHSVKVDSGFYRGSTQYIFEYWEGGSTDNPLTVNVACEIWLKAYYINPPYAPPTPSGPSSGYRWQSYLFSTSTTDPNGDSLKYQFDWGDGASTWTGNYIPSGATASLSHNWNSIGSYHIRTRAKDTVGLYSDWSSYKTMNIVNQPGNPCPTLFVWDGSEHVEVGILDIHSESDITFIQCISQRLAAENHLYTLSLRELDEFTSHIDYVRLFVVDSEVERYECHIVQAVHSELGQVQGLLLRDDNRRVDLSPQQTVDLKFTAPNVDEINYFVFEINGYNIKP